MNGAGRVKNRRWNTTTEKCIFKHYVNNVLIKSLLLYNRYLPRQYES